MHAAPMQRIPHTHNRRRVVWRSVNLTGSSSAAVPSIWLTEFSLNFNLLEQLNQTAEWLTEFDVTLRLPVRRRNANNATPPKCAANCERHLFDHIGERAHRIRGCFMQISMQMRSDKIITHLSSCTRDSPWAMVLLQAASVCSLCCSPCSSRRSAASSVSAATSSSPATTAWRRVSSHEQNCRHSMKEHEWERSGMRSAASAARTQSEFRTRGCALWNLIAFETTEIAHKKALCLNRPSWD